MKNDGARGIAQEAADRHGQHPGLRLQQAPRATAAAFDEVFDRVATRHDRGQVLHEDDGIQRVATETATNEEGTALTQETAHNREVEVDAGRDVRDGEAIHIDHIRQQQVVHVAAMARHIDDLVAFSRALERLDVPELDAVVKTVPQPGQGAFHEADERVRVVRSDLFCETLRAQNRLVARELLLAHLLRDNSTYGTCFQHARNDRTAVGKVGAYARCAMLRVKGTQGARDASATDCHADLLTEKAAERNRIVEFDDDVAPVEKDLHEPARARR